VIFQGTTKPHYNIITYLIDLASQLGLEDEFYVSQSGTVFNSEWVKWTKQEVALQDTSVLSYLQGREKEFLIVTQMAKDHLAIPSTSAASKCAFSSSSDLIMKKRNQLGGDNIRKLICIIA
jgi:hypothetical protein